MAKVRLENFDIHLKKELKNEEFRKIYEIECAKVSLAQKIAKSLGRTVKISFPKASKQDSLLSVV